MNREQAKILAPIVAAFAAGSTIEVRNNQTMFNWRKIEGVFDMEACLRAGCEFRIAPKPQKKQIVNIALFNTAEQGKWNPAYVLVPKRHANTTKRSNGFIRWLAEDIELKRNETGVKAQEVRHA